MLKAISRPRRSSCFFRRQPEGSNAIGRKQSRAARGLKKYVKLLFLQIFVLKLMWRRDELCGSCPRSSLIVVVLFCLQPGTVSSSTSSTSFAVRYASEDVHLSVSSGDEETMISFHISFETLRCRE